MGARTSTATVTTCSLSLYTDGLAPCRARTSTASKTWQTMWNNTVFADGLAQPGARTLAVTLLIWYFVIPTGGLALLDVRASEAIRTLLNLFMGTVTAVGSVPLGNQSIYSFISYIFLATYMPMAWHYDMPRHQLLQSRHSLRIIVKFRFCPMIGVIKTWGRLLDSDNTDWSHMAALANAQPVSMCEPQADKYEQIQNLKADFHDPSCMSPRLTSRWLCAVLDVFGIYSGTLIGYMKSIFDTYWRYCTVVFWAQQLRLWPLLTDHVIMYNKTPL